MADFDVALESSEINVTLVLERTVGGEGGGGVTSWNDLEDKPSTFPPTSHNHDDLYFTEAEVTTLLAPIGKFARQFRCAINDYFLTTVGLGASYSSTAVSSSATNSDGRGKLTPFYIAEPTTIDAMALYLVAVNDGAGAVVRMGIYEDDNGRPGNVVVDAGTASINGAASLKTLTFTPVTLQPGFYWAVAGTYNLNTGGVNPTFASVTGTQAVGDSAASGSNNMFPIATVPVTGALTTHPTISLSRSTSAAAFHIWVRRSA